VISMEFNETAENVAERTRTQNYEGGEAFEPDSAELALTKLVINNLLEANFYNSAEEQLEAVEEAFEACAEVNSEFVLKLAAYARQEENLRQIPQALLVLAANDDRTKQYVREYAPHIMSRADEPLDVLAYHVAHTGSKSIPSPLQKGIEDALHTYSEWQVAKWDQPNREWQYRDLLNLVHPNPRDEEREQIFEQIAHGELDHYDVEPLTQTDTWESSLADDTVTIKTHFDEWAGGQSVQNGILIINLIERYDGGPPELMFHTAKDGHHDGWVMKNLEAKSVYEKDGSVIVEMELSLGKADKYRNELMEDQSGNSMGLFPRIRQARDMLQAGVTADEIYGDVTDEWIRNSRLYPFRFYQSYKAVRDADNIPQEEREAALDWLESAIRTSTESLPDVLEDTFVAVDTSGSMNAPVSGGSDLLCSEIAALFGSLMYTRGADVAAFASDLQEYNGDRRDTIPSIMDDLRRMPIGGGTNGYLIPKELDELERDEYSQVIVLSDMQLWADNSADSYKLHRDSHDTFSEEWSAYTNETNPEASLYCIDLQNYGELAIPEGQDDVYQISGWSESIIDYIDRMEGDVDGMIGEIESFEP